MSKLQNPEWEAFQPLRETQLHLIEGPEWEAYYAKAVPFLISANAGVRHSVVERLMMAVFICEGKGPLQDRPPREHMQRRETWLYDRLEQAHAQSGDILPEFLQNIRFNTPSNPKVLTARLRKWAKSPPPGVHRDHIAGGLMVLTPPTKTACKAWLRQLDDPSDYIRAFAARRLGEEIDLWAESDAAAFEMIFAKEVARPGIAGPFWSDACYAVEDTGFDYQEWMMRILEQRSGPEPADLPFNGIDFYAHEACSQSPEMVQRMLRLGMRGLAFETALEQRRKEPRMLGVLMEMGAASMGEWAPAIRHHLALYHGVIHPDADPKFITELPGFAAGVRAILCGVTRCIGPDQTVRQDELALHPLAEDAPIPRASVEGLIDAAAPKDLRGPLTPYLGLAEPGDPAESHFVGDDEMRSFDNGLRVNIRWLKGQDAAELIRISGNLPWLRPAP